jgi:hypothetical protein
MSAKILRSLVLLLPLSLTLSFTSWATAATITLQDGLNTYAGTIDNWIVNNSGADINRGDNVNVAIRSTSNYGIYRFAIFANEGGPLPNNAVITSATLSLYKAYGPDGVMRAQRLTKAWTEMGSTWNSTGTQPWTTPGGDVVGTPDGTGSVPDAEANNCADGIGHEICWLHINVTTGVQAFAANPGTNFGWRVSAVSSSEEFTPKNFNSRNISNPAIIQYRPKLTITYDDGGCTPPTANLTATPTSGAAPLNVTLNASGSVDGSSPITSLRLQFSDGTPDLTWGNKATAQQHTFNLPNGEKTATLTVTSACNTSAPVVRTVTVGTVPPQACIPSDKTAAGVAVPTFHSMGLYYNPATAPTNGKIFMRYRKGSDDPNVAASWKAGHDLWYDSRSGMHNYQARGSAVHLDPGTPYVFEVSRDGTTWDNSIQGQAGEACPATWTETANLPISPTPGPTWSNTRTTTTSSAYPFGYKGSARNRFHVFHANQSGSASGYTLYDFTGLNATAHQTSNTTDRYAMVISGHHMIIRGLTVRGGASSIFIDPGSTDIILEDLKITGYGRESTTPLGAGLTGNRAINEDAAIHFPSFDFGSAILNTKRIVIQRTTMYNPAHGANPWDGTNHPEGASPITIYPTGGQIVVRYNTTYSTTNGEIDGPPDLDKFHADGLILGGCNDRTGSNCSNTMGIGADVDVYKNLVMHYYDDGIELDGDGTNVRAWKNYFDYGGASAVSATPTYVGPAYIWRNVYNRAREWITEPWGNENGRRDSMIKAGGIAYENGPSFNGGRRYVYHNTSLQPDWESEPEAVGPNPLGTGLGVKGTGGLPAVVHLNGLQNTVTRNNVYENWKTGWSAFGLNHASNNDLDYDLTNSICWWGPAPSCTGSYEPNGHRNTPPSYLSGNGWLTPGGPQYHGKYRLSTATGTKGYRDGEPIPNFNNGTTANRPDRGAHDNTMADMDFGTTASGH